MRAHPFAPIPFALGLRAAAVVAAALGLALPGPASAAAASPPLFIQGVSANETSIAFGYAGRIWTVGREGGRARALTSGPGEDVFPAYSPDGESLAFTRYAGGGTDVWVTGAAGGEPRRLTWHPKHDLVRGWSPDGERVLFASGRDGDGLWRFYTVAAAGGFPAELPLPQGYQGAFSPDGSRLAYAPVSEMVELHEYRYYRGGLTSPLWIADLSDSSVEVIEGTEANHRFPMWIGETLCYVSDETGIANLFCRDLAAGSVRQLTHFETYGIRMAGAASSGDVSSGRASSGQVSSGQVSSGQVVVFVRAGRIHLADLETGAVREVAIEVDPGGEEPAPRTVTAGDFLESAVPSPDGARLALEARGEVLLLDLATAESAVLTASSEAADRGPSFSPDGRRLAWFSDASGEYRLCVRSLAEPETRCLEVEERPSFYRQIVWSPDGRRLVFSGKRLGLWLADVEAGEVERIDRSAYLAQELWNPSWSVDGRYLAYAKGFPEHRRGVFVLDTETGEKQLVSGDLDATSPVFDPNGRYLHFLAGHIAPLAAATEIWGLLSAEWAAPLVVRQVHTVLLGEGEPPPYLPLLGEPHPAAEPGTVATGVVVDFEGLAHRVVRLPVPERDLFELAAGEPGVLWLRARKWPEAPGASRSLATPLYRFRLGGEEGLVEAVEDVDAFALSADGRTLVTRSRDGLFVRGVSEDSVADSRRVDLSAVEIPVDPAAEWRQIHREAWRMMRDYFYDPGHHGQDLAALEAHFAEYLPSITRREELTDFLRYALGHVSISHLSVRGGDVPRSTAPPDRVGTLGAEFEVHEGRYRVRHVYRSGSAGATNRLVASAPLDQPGSRVEAGEYLLEVNGEPLDASRNLYRALAGTAFKPTRLRVGPHADGSGSREVLAVALGGDNSIKRADVYAAGRRRVEELSSGRLGYVEMPNYGFGAMQEFVGQLAAARDKEGLVIDQRWGPGGITADYLIYLLTARPLHRYAFPYGEDLTVPTLQAPPGPKVLLINEQNASASETFPLMFKIAGVGTVVGKRTAGAGTGGALDYPPLIDGGRITIPNRASFNPETGVWAENRGVEPDVEVEWWPAEWRAGRDPQLEMAVEIALSEIEKAPPPREVERPEYPVHPR